MSKQKILSTILVISMIASMLSLTAVGSFAAGEGITEAVGHLESAYVEWTPIDGVDAYNVYVAKSGSSAWTRIDDYLIRKYSGYYRADALGLSAGDYVMKVVPVKEGAEQTAEALTTNTLSVLAHDRSGYAHSNISTGVGAYNNDGTLKSGAQVIYLTADTAKTCTAIVNGVSYTGIQTILDAKQKKGATDILCIRIIGLVTLSDLDHISSSAQGLQIKGNNGYAEMNITVEGVGEDATVSGFGFLIRNCKGVEIRNLGIMNFMDDGISVDTNNSNLWIHNCDFFYGGKGSDADQAKGDGSLDTKKSQYITYSYNHFIDSGKVNLVGNGSSDSVNYLTFHHNWYDHADSRMPRVRSATVHVYNNFYDGVSKYGIGSTLDSDIFSEANYFLNTKHPILISKQGSDIATDSKGTFSGEAGGIVKSYGDVMVGCGAFVSYQKNNTQFDAYVASSRNETVPSSVKAALGGATYNNFDTSADFYDYNVDAAEQAKENVIKYAGRINGGDFKWSFTAADNSDYEVNESLKAAITSYKSSILSIGTGSTGSTGGSTGGTGGNQGGDNTGGETGGNTGGGSSGGTTLPVGSYTHNFTTDGKTDEFFSISGNTSTSKGSVTYAGLTLTTCLKIEEETSISFNAPADGKLTLVFGGSKTASGKSIKLDGEKQTIGTDSIITLDVTAGSHTVTKGDSINLFYMVYTPDGAVSEHTHSYSSQVTTEATCTVDGLMTYTCSCGDSYTEKLDASGHEYDYEITAEATCAAEGVITYTCPCGEAYIEKVAAKGHDYVDGFCVNCGVDDPNYTTDPDENPDENPGENTDENPGENPGENPDENPGENGDNNEEPKEELGFFEALWLALVNFFKWLFGIKD